MHSDTVLLYNMSVCICMYMHTLFRVLSVLKVPGPSGIFSSSHGGARLPPRDFGALLGAAEFDARWPLEC